MRTDRQPALVSAELVEDLNLRRFCIADQRRFPRDAFWIDRRRLKRELRRLPALRAAARQRFDAQVLTNYSYHRVGRPIIILDDVRDEPLTEEQRKRVLDWWDRANQRSISPAADMFTPIPR